MKTASPFRTAGPGRRHSASGRLLFAAGCAAVWDAQEVEVVLEGVAVQGLEIYSPEN